MTTDQEAEDMAAAVLHRMTQRGITAREWERQSKQWEAQARGESARADAAERDVTALQKRLAYADRALADMVNQYMSFPEGYITHEFMSAQEEAIDYLETIGWLRAGELERYYWTDAALEATKEDAPSLSVQWYAERAAYLEKIEQLTLAMDEAVQTYATELEVTRGELARVRDAADHAISNLRAIKSLNDDPTIEQIVDETADALGEVLHAD